jgi:hypothetical protein
MTDPKEFANRVSGLILDQIDRDRNINKENIAFLLEKEIVAHAPPGLDKDKVVESALYLRAALQGMPGSTVWTKDALQAFKELTIALREEGRLG